MAPPTVRLFTPAFVELSIAELAYFTAFGIAIYTLLIFGALVSGLTVLLMPMVRLLALVLHWGRFLPRH